MKALRTRSSSAFTGMKNAFSTPALTSPRTIVGIWELKSREDVDEAGATHSDPLLGRQALGILCFAPRHFSAQFMKRDRYSGEHAFPVQLENNSIACNIRFFGACSGPG